MACYCYRLSDNNVVIRQFPIGKAPKSIRVGKRKALRDITAEHDPLGQRPLKGKWPIFSDQLGVHPIDIPRAKAHAKKIGIPTDFTPDGRAVLREPKHRKRYSEALGFYDRNSYGTSREAAKKEPLE